MTTEKKIPLSPEQDCAANPTKNVWVQANAGTGKTSVLTQRLLRILFRTPDVLQTGILCLTYTNAGAGEMRNRILKNLKKWACCSDDDMRILLDGITVNKNISDSDIAHAREIFFTYIDNSDLLKIKTIHGFCEEILHRFPTEAHISPTWKLVSDADQRVLLWDAFNNMISNSKDATTNAAFGHIVERVSEYIMDDLLNILEQRYQDFFGITNCVKYREYFIDNIENFLQVKKVPNMKMPVENLKKISILAHALLEQKRAPKYLQTIETATNEYLENKISFDEYKNAYLTEKGSKIKRTFYNEIFADEQERVFAINEYLENKKIYDDTIALFDLSAAFAHSYMELKRSKNILDFADLILYTRKLFSNPETMGWVLSQMDISLSHILVDEAQDTSPQQWDIIRLLTGDFFNDGDNTELPRSLFVVGDTKQSIYGFQGADPNAFIHSRDDIANQIQNNCREIQEIPLLQNFRSLPSVLYAVDTFFQDETVKNVSGFVNQKHLCARQKTTSDLGLVELHRIIAKQESQIEVSGYIKNIAQKIKDIIDTTKYTASDIMVLVQNRNPFMNPLVLELKKLNIDVAGSDRIVLPQFPAIRDLLNLIRFCLDTNDDYALCCVLKSPLFRFSETDIYTICCAKNRAVQDAKQDGKIINTPTVFSVLSEYQPDVFADLSDIIQQSAKLAPYSFFTYVLRKNNNRQKMIAALGEQIIDPLEEFITICLSYERTQPGTLQDFLKWFITGGAQVKRDMDSVSGVRIATIHGSKGLEAPVVFLIDTVRIPDIDNIIPLPIIKQEEFETPWIWRTSGTTKTECIKSALDTQKQLQIAEYYRLLYVAMTRARDELYIYGYTPNKNPNELSWYTHLWRVFCQLYNTPISQEYIRIQHEQPIE